MDRLNCGNFLSWNPASQQLPSQPAPFPSQQLPNRLQIPPRGFGAAGWTPPPPQDPPPAQRCWVVLGDVGFSHSSWGHWGGGVQLERQTITFLPVASRGSTREDIKARLAPGCRRKLGQTQNGAFRSAPQLPATCGYFWPCPQPQVRNGFPEGAKPNEHHRLGWGIGLEFSLEPSQSKRNWEMQHRQGGRAGSVRKLTWRGYTTELVLRDCGRVRVISDHQVTQTTQVA